MVQWLQAAGVEVDPKWLKPECWQQCKNRKPQPRYRVDRMLREAGHSVLRTPPYHPEYQPIELVWKDIKMHVARNNTFKIGDIPALIRQGIDAVTPERCASYAARCAAVAREDAQRAGALDRRELIINFSSSEESSSSSEQEEDGVEEEKGN